MNNVKNLTIIGAGLNNLKEASYLFNEYRIFYNQISDIEKCHNFLLEKLNNNQSLIYLGLINNKAVAFMQLYQGFSSIALEKYFILNDLYVDKNYRGNNIGKMMVKKALEISIQNNISKIILQTAKDNEIAQNLYHSLGFVLDQEFLSFYNNNISNSKQGR